MGSKRIKKGIDDEQSVVPTNKIPRKKGKHSLETENQEMVNKQTKKKEVESQSLAREVSFPEKKKKKQKQAVLENNKVEHENINDIENGTEKKKKKQKQVVLENNEEQDNVNDLENGTFLTTERKKKKHKETVETTEEEHETLSDTENESAPKTEKRKKKYKQTVIINEKEPSITSDASFAKHDYYPEKIKQKTNGKRRINTSENGENMINSVHDSAEDTDPTELENLIKNLSQNKEEQQSSGGNLYHKDKNETKIKKPEKHFEITWPSTDLIDLIGRMEQCIPADDHLRFKSRISKLEWEKIAFKNYTIEECQQVWSHIEKKVRGFRLLGEVLKDAKDVVPKLFNVSEKQKNHPDLPRRPPSAYLLFFTKKKDNIFSENPGIDVTEASKLLSQMYKNLPPEKKQKYENIAAKKREEYNQQLEIFYQNHPEIPDVIRRKKIGQKSEKIPKQKPERIPKIKPETIPKTKPEKSPRPVKDKAPTRPGNPFRLFYLSELKKENIPDNDKLEVRDKCRETWKQMSDKKKLQWINWAEDEYAKYQEELEKYMSSHPEYVPSKIPFLSKEDVAIKERFAGKPIKPPTSAHGYFSSNLLQSDFIKTIPAKERFNYVASQWKLCPEEEKQKYKNHIVELAEQYKKDFALYLEKLPEDKRKLELQNNLPKKRKSEKEGHEAGPSKKKVKLSKPKQKPKFKEPEQPPISAYKYFAKLYDGEEPVAQAWKALSTEDKQKYEQELVKTKQAYIVEFEKFLKSLSKEELEAFSNSRKQSKVQDEHLDEETDENSDDESDSESGDEDDESN